MNLDHSDCTELGGVLRGCLSGFGQNIVHPRDAGISPWCLHGETTLLGKLQSCGSRPAGDLTHGDLVCISSETTMCGNLQRCTFLVFQDSSGQLTRLNADDDAWLMLIFTHMKISENIYGGQWLNPQPPVMTPYFLRSLHNKRMSSASLMPIWKAVWVGIQEELHEL